LDRDIIKVNLVKTIMKSKLVSQIIRTLGNGRAQAVANDILPFLAVDGSFLEIGAGTCQVTDLLRQSSMDVTPIDVKDYSVIDSIVPVIYDGDTLPFDDKKFDVAMLLNVLHHTKDPERVLKEAARVAKRVVIYEDVYKTTFQKLATFAMDSVTNFEFIGHPHSNKTDAGWREAFERLGYEVEEVRYKKFWRVFQNALYVVKT
jgi:ubiquinone/menaquinone biosynthesis C-methylase UbiE